MAKVKVSNDEIINYLRITGAFKAAALEVTVRKATLEAARKKGIRITTQELQKVADAFRMLHGLKKAKDTFKWMKERGISLQVFEKYIETNLLIGKFTEQLTHEGKKAKYLESREVRHLIQKMMYEEWLTKTIT